MIDSKMKKRRRIKKYFLKVNKDYGTKSWFENQFKNLDARGDRWGHRWRGSQKFRYDLYTKILKNILPTKKKIKILDIGCALGDFTKRVWQLNLENEIFGIDISENAINRISEEYPDMKFMVGSLPKLSFKENSFDLILCLEVLYYLNKEGRVESLKNIRKVLKPDGYLFFSGVLDGGVRYFAEDEIIELISNYFDIEAVEYNYSRIYITIESKFLSLLTIGNTIETLLNMTNEEFLKWCDGRKDKQKVEKVKKFRKIINRVPFGGNIIKATVRFMDSVIRRMLSWKVPASLSYKFTKLILREKGKTQIIILARKNYED